MNFTIIFFIIGSCLIIFGFWEVIKKEAFEKDEIAKLIYEAFSLNEKAKKKIRITIGIISIVMGLFILLNGLLMKCSELCFLKWV